MSGLSPEREKEIRRALDWKALHGEMWQARCKELLAEIDRLRDTLDAITEADTDQIGGMPASAQERLEWCVRQACNTLGRTT